MDKCIPSCRSRSPSAFRDDEDDCCFMFPNLDVKTIVLWISQNQIKLFTDPFSIDCEVEKYSCCDGIGALLEIKKSLLTPLINIGRGVHISKPINFNSIAGAGRSEGEIREEKFHFASVSHEGVLFMCYYHNFNRFIMLIDIFTLKHVKIKVSHLTIAAFYDNNIILLSCGKKLCEAQVKKVFRHPKYKRFKAIKGSHQVHPWCDVSKVHTSRKLVYISYLLLPYEYDVDTKKTVPIKHDKHIGSFGSTTGINVGAKYVFYEEIISSKRRDLIVNEIEEIREGRNNNRHNNKTYLCHQDNKLEILSGQDPRYLLTAVIPSSSQPEMLSKALRFHNDKRCYVGEGGEVVTTNNFTYSGCYSLVRLYKDVFLLYDQNSRSWVLVRIKVD